MSSENRYKIAIIGSGISGLSAAYMLYKHHDLTIYEASSKLGGHSNTITVQEQQRSLNIDTGFIVFNKRNYPHFSQLISALDVPVIKTDMSLGAYIKEMGFWYSGSNVFNLLKQNKNYQSKRFYTLMRDIIRFNRYAKSYVTGKEPMSIDKFFRLHKLSDIFYQAYLYPLSAAIWSSDEHDVREMPAQFVIPFFNNHQLLRIANRPQWLTLKNGSQEYVEKIRLLIKSRILTNSKVYKVERLNNRVTVCTEESEQGYDKVIIATHSDQALKLLADASSMEGEILSAIKYRSSQAVLHNDATTIGYPRKYWSSWNFMDRDGQAIVCYDMNKLQSLKTKTPYLVSLNDDQVRQEDIIYKTQYSHPIISDYSRQAARKHSLINGVNNTYYTGAYWGSGFHEDGIQATINAIQSLRHSVI